MEITLAGQKYELHEQGFGRIRRKLKSVAVVFGPVIGGVEDEIPDEMGDSVYEALQVFIPDLAPVGELMGYSTQADYERVEAADTEYAEALEAWAEARAEAAEKGEDAPPRPEPPSEDDLPTYSPKKDVKPNEVFTAIDKIFEVHGGQRLVRLLKSVFGAEALSAVARSRLLKAEQASSRR